MKRNGPDQGPNQEPGKPAGKSVEPPADQQAAHAKAAKAPTGAESSGLAEAFADPGQDGAVKFDAKTGRLEVGPGMIVQISKDVTGKGYCIEPVSGFDGKDPFGGYRWKNLVAAKTEAPKIAAEWVANSRAMPKERFSLKPSPDIRAMAELIANGMAEQLTNALPDSPLGQYIAAEAMFQAFNDRINDFQAKAREGSIREILQRIHDVVDDRISAVRISPELEEDDDDVARYAPSFEFEWDEDGDGHREFVAASDLDVFKPFLRDDPLQTLRDLTLREMEYHTDPIVVRL